MAAGAFAACGVMAEAREAAVRLLGLLQSTGADPRKQDIANQIISCIDRARAAVRERKTEQGLAAQPPAPAGSKRRSRGCGEARARIVSSTMDDGYAWRKYGEKSIHHHKNPRFYFRCAYRDELGCGARKQVDRMEDYPSLFHVAYFGEHTPACPRDASAAEVDRDSRFVVQTSPDSFRPCLLPVEGEELPANSSMVEFTAEYWPLKDQLEGLVSSHFPFASPGELESLDASLDLEELMNCSRHDDRVRISPIINY